MKLPKPHVRVTEATLRKQENYRKLLDRMKQGGMILAEICEVLGMSPSGGRKYLRVLVAEDVVGTSGFFGARQNFVGFPIWTISSEEAVENFLDAVKQVRSHTTVPRKKLSEEKTPGIHIYMAHDDMRFAVQRTVVIPRRDELVAAFFGPGGAAV